MQLVFKISNLCAPDPATLQSYRQTDDMQSQYRALYYSASRGKNDHQDFQLINPNEAQAIKCLQGR